MLSARPVARNVPLAPLTRFGVGGPADFLFETPSEDEFIAVLRAVRASGQAFAVLGGGTNIIVSDAGFRGWILRFTGAGICSQGLNVTAQAGAELGALVEYTVDRGLKGLETLAGVPGWVGAAVYGNAGAYGHSISERVERVRFFDGCGVREIGNAECEFRYRESIFKRHRDWVILSATFSMIPGDAAELRRTVKEILDIRNQKFPPTMKCAGSIFKNLLAADLPADVLAQTPPEVVREGKIPAAYFLEQVGAKGLACGGMRVADYHANLIYNAGGGTAAELHQLVSKLKERVRARFGIELEEEVQYLGEFPEQPLNACGSGC